jgi:hypothetical protein
MNMYVLFSVSLDKYLWINDGVLQWNEVQSKSINEYGVNFLQTLHREVNSSKTSVIVKQPLPLDDGVDLGMLYNAVVRGCGWDDVLVAPMRIVSRRDDHMLTLSDRVVDFTEAFKL